MKPTLKLVRRLDETVSTMSSMLDKLLDINQLEAGIVRAEVVDFPINRLLEEMRAEFTIHTAANGLDLARGSEQPHRAQRSRPSRADHSQSVVERGEVHHRGQAAAGLPAPRRQGLHRSLGHRPWNSGKGLQAIFEEFNQLENPARERSKGLGLGLAIVQRLAGLLGHKVDVRSRLGAGSVFTIEVPLGRPEVAAVAAPSEREEQTSTLASGTVLIVDDDRGFARNAPAPHGS